jgi:hypothetical protein
VKLGGVVSNIVVLLEQRGQYDGGLASLFSSPAPPLHGHVDEPRFAVTKVDSSAHQNRWISERRNPCLVSFP